MAGYRAAGESDDGVRRDRKVSVINEKSMVLFAFFGYKRKSRRNFAGGQDGYGHKKRAPLSPTFVNLKSNTMKNTMQRYGFWGNLQIIQGKKYVL